jgi:hypothetical protein
MTSLSGLQLSEGRKYSSDQLSEARLVMGDDLPDHIVNLIAASYAKSSWSKLITVMNAVRKFEADSNSICKFPMSQEILLNFSAWGYHVNKWKASTISAYVSSLATVHKLRNLDINVCNNFLTKRLIQGVQNLEMYEESPTHTRKVMTLPLLIILGNQIAITSWADTSKQIVWTAALLAFFGCMRFGELLTHNKNSFCPDDTLLWSDIKSLDGNSYLIHVKTPKSKAKEGEFVDIFEFEDFGVCPVAALRRLKLMLGGVDSKPVFMFPEGHCLTLNCMNMLIKSLMYPVLGEYANYLSCHSFRSAIPSALGKIIEPGGGEDTKDWGRWSSSAYLLYSRLKLDRKKAIFAKVIQALGLQASHQPSAPRS